MGTASAILAHQSEIGQLRDRIAELENRQQAAQDEHRQLVAALQTEKDRLAAVIASISDEVWFADSAKRLVLVNPPAAREFNLDGANLIEVEKLVGSLQVFRPNGSPRPVEEAPPLRALKGEIVRGQEEIVRTPASGELRHREVSASPVRDASGAIIGSVCVVRDITDRKRTEAALRDSEERFRIMADGCPAIIWVTDGRGGNRFSNRAYHEFFGVAPEDVEGTNWWTLIHPDDAQRYIEAALCAFQQQAPFRAEARMRRADSEWRHITAYAEPGRSPDGEYLGHVGIIIDVTEQKRAEQASRNSEERFRSVLEGSRDVIYQYNVQKGRFEYISSSAQTVVGFSVEELMAQDSQAALAMLHPDDLPTMQAAIALLHETGKAEAEYRQLAKSGEYRWLSNSMSLTKDSAGRPLYRNGSIRDITDRKLAGETLSQSEEQFRVLTQNMYSGVALVDERGAFTIANPSFRRMFGLSQNAEILNVNSRDWAQWQVFDERGLLLNVDEHPVRRAALTLTAVKNQLVAVKPPSSPDLKWLLVSAEPVLDALGKLSRLVCTFYDITARKSAEEALRESEARFRLALKKTPVSVAAQDLDLRYIWAYNQRSARPDQIVGHFDHEIFTAEEAAHITAVKRRVLEEGIEQREQMWFDRPTGRMYLDIRWEPIRDQAGRIVGVASATVDLTPIKLAGEALRQSDERLRIVVENSRDGINLLDFTTGQYVLMSPAQVELTGFTAEEINNISVEEALERVHPDDREIFLAQQRLVASGQDLPAAVEYRWKVKSGDYRWFSDSRKLVRDAQGRPVALVGISRDITDQKRAAERQRQTQKLESIGLLAGGIAHDFNNLLTGVMGSASLLLEDAPPEHAKLLRSIVSATERAAHLTRQLLAYSGKGQFIIRDLDITQAVSEAADLVQFSIPKSAGLTLNLDRRLPPVAMDPAQLQQTLMNLVINAGEAIGEGNPGRITVTTSITDIGRPFTDDNGEDIAPGRYVCIEVHDTGAGLDPGKKSKIFDPFFTTKFFGRGLGLAAVAGILRSQKGGITVESAPGEGTTFRVFLPAAAKGAVAIQEPIPGKGCTSVLVVDDEATVRDFIGLALRRKGYQVVEASDGRQALALCEAAPDAIRAAIVDIIMPNMAANELLPALKARQPGIRILLTSGYSEAEARRLCASSHGAAFIQKPYTAQQLANALGDLLAEQSP